MPCHPCDSLFCFLLLAFSAADGLFIERAEREREREYLPATTHHPCVCVFVHLYADGQGGGREGCMCGVGGPGSRMDGWMDGLRPSSGMMSRMPLVGDSRESGPFSHHTHSLSPHLCCATHCVGIASHRITSHFP
uniref:Secreted protein n=1 Tax=Vitrella brassicaformis TaxID=1169539 RepID=A0A7S1KHZ5_9ALVE|mmetsp:Transcript_6438/g.15551  ORF Transcript_6438/g.15551 Transcript_6438/m.15551 type:complete len:135 (+) Transcript_6438:163-567(+)